MSNQARPRYSHAGDGNSGTVTGNGKPIFLGDNCVAADMNITVTGGNATVFLECSGGVIDNSTGLPPEGSWIDVTGGSGYAMTPTTPVAKVCPVGEPYWRTRISAIDVGASVESYIPGIRTFTGDWISASRPPQSSPPNQGF